LTFWRLARSFISFWLDGSFKKGWVDFRALWRERN
jgi:hypothetical protein